MDTKKIHEWLVDSLDRRERPESIIQKITELGVKVPTNIGRMLNYSYSYSSMSNDFDRPKCRPEAQIKVATELLDLSAPEATSLDGISRFLVDFESSLKIEHGKLDFKADRLNKAQRKEKGIDLSRRQYNKLFRVARRLNDKATRYESAIKQREFTQISKSRLACRLKAEDLQDENTLMFVAYYTSKCNKRSVFTSSSQERPFDEICKELLQRCKDSSTTNWLAIAYVYPEQEVLNKLSQEEKGKLLAQWFEILRQLAKLLEPIWEKNGADSKKMIVKKGMDSSTWNALAGAWNKSRDAWISLLTSLKLQGLLDQICVGKVMRLMAADVVYLHSWAKKDNVLEPDTQVWADLPKPWDVLEHRAECNRELVEMVCEMHGVDPREKGWTLAKKYDAVHDFAPTPELVHGVAVQSPELALWFKAHKYFSGKI